MNVGKGVFSGENNGRLPNPNNMAAEKNFKK